MEIHYSQRQQCNSPNANKTYWSIWHNLAWLIFLIVIPCFAWRLLNDLSNSLLHVWWLFIFGFTAILLVTGHGITGSWKGLLIDNRNIISLSRFQMIAWTIIVLSAFCAAVFWNIVHDDIVCLANTDKGCLPSLPETLWLLMGFSTASLIGSPLILRAKKNLQPDVVEMGQTFELLSQQGYDISELSHQGHLVVNAKPNQARWSDLFTGEETGNFAYLDLARMQMFFFTLVSLLSYGVLLGHQFGTATAIIKDFPVLNEGLLALIGISHTGYLASKASQNSQIGNSISPEINLIDDDQPAVG